mgnify:CR=1 FL=1
MILLDHTKMRSRASLFLIGMLLITGVLWFSLRKFQPEAFEDSAALPTKVDIADLPDPRTVFKGLRALLDKYDNPAVLGHVTQVMDKDPGQLARMNLRIQN